MSIYGGYRLSASYGQNPSGNVFNAKAEAKFQILAEIVHQFVAVDHYHEFKGLLKGP
jgi:hypothetical protein